MRHSNISIFVPHAGCPHKCSFCDQHSISGKSNAPHADEVKKICNEALEYVEDKENCEIAFFGGSFTAIPEKYMTELLESASVFTGSGKFKGIRISTRPDCIDERILSILKKYNVTSIELGCQSMDEEVLELNHRGHDAECVRKSCEMIKSFGFELGLQMMTGLYGSDPEKDMYTACEIIKLKPDTVRIYPVVILKNTELGDLFEKGIYKTYSLEKMISLCGEYMAKFSENKIRIIKCGLHASEMVESDMLGGYYHPAFRELCESAMFRARLEQKTEEMKGRAFDVCVNSRYLSKAKGQKLSNIKYFSEKGINIRIISDDSVNGDDFVISVQQQEK